MNIKDMPHVTVEQVLALRKAAIDLENKNYYLESKLAEERQGRDDAESLYIENLKKELATLKASLPKIKAEALLSIKSNVPQINDGFNGFYSYSDIKEYANKLEAGELDDCECEELGSICDHCEDDV